MDSNEKRAELLIRKYGFNYSKIKKEEIINLLNEEFEHYHERSSEYLRLLCGYLSCIGSKEDVFLIKKIKYKINMDVGCMIDQEFIEALESNDEEIKINNQKNFEKYYKDYFKL